MGIRDYMTADFIIPGQRQKTKKKKNVKNQSLFVILVNNKMRYFTKKINFIHCCIS